MVEGAIVPSFQFHIAHLIYPKAASWQGMSLRRPGILLSAEPATGISGEMVMLTSMRAVKWRKMCGLSRHELTLGLRVRDEQRFDNPTQLPDRNYHKVQKEWNICSS
jgi:hypothetical protein